MILQFDLKRDEMKKFEFIILGVILFFISCGLKSTNESRSYLLIKSTDRIQKTETSLITSKLLKKLVDVNKVSAADLPYTSKSFFSKHYALLPNEHRDNRLPLSLTDDITGKRIKDGNETLE